MTDAPGSVTFVVDSTRTIRESTAPELRVGDVLSASSWLGEAALEAIEAARLAGVPERRVGRDLSKGTHWVLHASVVGDEPWLARVVAFDATPAVAADRDAVFAKLLGSTRNVSVAMGSVLDVIELDRPTGGRLDECIAYLREPVRRLSATTTRLAAWLDPPRPSLRRVSVEALVERALSRAMTVARPAAVAIHPPGMMVSCDADLLSDTIVAMLEGAGDDPAPHLEVDDVHAEGRHFARLVVERRAPPARGPRWLAGAWDLHGGHHLETQLRLGVGRAVVFAHGGEVFAEGPEPGRVRLGIRLPVVASG